MKTVDRLDPYILYPVTAIYVLLGVTGTLGNTMVCAVIFRNISMRTSTNLFLFTLAVADIVILLMGELLVLCIYIHIRTLFDLYLHS